MIRFMAFLFCRKDRGCSVCDIFVSLLSTVVWYIKNVEGDRRCISFDVFLRKLHNTENVIVYNQGGIKMPGMTPDQILEYFKDKNSRKEYLRNIPNLTPNRKDEIDTNYENEDYAKTELREQLKQKGYYNRGFDIALETNLHKKNIRVLYLGGEEAVEVSESPIGPELQKKLEKGQICVSIDDQDELQLYQNGTYEFQAGFYGGGTF